MSACRITRIVRTSLPRYAGRPFQRRRRCLAAAEAQTGGLAAGVRWDLADLYAGPDDPRIEADLDAGPGGRAALRRATPGSRRQPLAPSPWPARSTELEAIGRARGPAGQLCAAALRRRHQRAAPRGPAAAGAGARRPRSATRWSSSSSSGWAWTTAPPAPCSRLRRSRGAGTSSSPCAATGRTCWPRPKRSSSRSSPTPGAAPSRASSTS